MDREIPHFECWFLVRPVNTSLAGLLNLGCYTRRTFTNQAYIGILASKIIINIVTNRSDAYKELNTK